MNKLKQVIADKCNELNITHQSLSKALGHSEVYLYDVMRKGVTTAKQDELIMRIGGIKEYKSDADIIAELKHKLLQAQLRCDNIEKSKNVIIESKDSIIDDQAQIIENHAKEIWDKEHGLSGLSKDNQRCWGIIEEKNKQIHHLESTMKATKREYFVWLSLMGAAIVCQFVWGMLK